ncbi:cytochrome b N-terminal domain-containing protein [Cryobacterium sp. PH31-AA6]|uniref:cytochrome b N-terminal domain-containing protein n=1 Tax=Cryobacterium sp. PH31-AA6 TaxID=3046205 RepID=UPI0024B91FFE|nr:cytochrome b N-terminal domain-containing protein [Cryobacterium sp. PH31-AA6]MDJ0323799.1 cytochrome b N-terminal domain-containing protein [Cryobacterium sp. PH31-AA6]
MSTELANGKPASTPEETRSWSRKAWDVIDERMGISALAYPVPEHANRIAWTLGGITVLSFVLLIGSGIILTQFYAPRPALANLSVRAIEANDWGRLFRGVHFWASQAMYVATVLHLVRVFLTGSYKRPREGNWLVGVAMFGLLTFAVFTGTVLKWDQEAYEALGHNLELGKLLGGVGFWFSPGFSSGVSILLRLYGAHVVIIPGMILVLVFLHFLLVKRHHMSPHPALPVGASPDQAPDSEPTQPFTRHIRRLVAFGVALSGLLGILAILLPAPIGSPPVAGIEITLPPWMFWWPFTLENWFGLAAIVWGEVVFFLLLAILPFVDRNPNRLWRRRPVAMTIAAVLALALIVLTILMAVTPAQTHL